MKKSGGPESVLKHETSSVNGDITVAVTDHNITSCMSNTCNHGHVIASFTIT
jgi:hypothetical protein